MTTLIDEIILRSTNAWIFICHPRLRRACLRHFGRFPDLARPIGHDALMQWRKVFDRNPLFVTFCDKLATREWARGQVPDIDLAELIWTGTDVRQLKPAQLTPDVVLKVSSGTGANYFPSRDAWDEATIHSRFAQWLRRPKRGQGEWAYGRLPPRLLIERLNGPAGELVDLNIRCQNGRVASAFAALAWKTPDARGMYLDASGAPLDDGRSDTGGPVLPDGVFERAAGIARRLSREVDHVRVDFQVRGSKIFLGEMTVYSSSGFGEEEEVGIGALVERQWIAELERSWFLSTRHSWPLALYQGAFRRWLRRRQAELAVA